MEGGAETERCTNPSSGLANNQEEPKPKLKPKVVVIMGPTGAGKSRLSVGLASHFPIEIINADSMQVYQGLDVLTNKIPLDDQKGVPHHLLGTISPDVEFTAKDFRDSAISLIDDILSRNHLPVIVGGTNYYIQALVSPFLLDDAVEDVDENISTDPYGHKKPDSRHGPRPMSFSYNHDCLKDLDPVAANRIHPNDHRKINQFLSMYARTGVLPSKLLQGRVMEKWGQVDNFRYDCCFICADASLPVLDKFVEQRVDCMVDSGLLNEVYDIYNSNADYTCGLRQAIGVREFDNFLGIFLSKGLNCKETKFTADNFQISMNNGDKISKEKIREILNSSNENPLKLLLEEAIDKVKANTRRLVRRQKRRLNRLQTLFGWNIHYVDSSETLLCMSEDSWVANVLEPSMKTIRSFVNENVAFAPNSEARNGTEGLKLIQRDVWTPYLCEACGNKVLRGAHEWEQHKQGKSHRKRISSLRKSGNISLDRIAAAADSFL